MAAKKEMVFNAITAYMNESIAFKEDMKQLDQMLSTDEPIVEFCHFLDCFLFDDESKRYIMENNSEFHQTFKERLVDKVTKERLDGKKIWLFLKYKNLPEKLTVVVKKSSELEELPKDVIIFTVDSLQIVALTETYRKTIGRKYAPKNCSDSGRHPKYVPFEVHDQTDESPYSDQYYESKKERIHCNARKFVAKIGQNWLKEKSNPIEIDFYLNTLTDKELEAIYDGSHLETVVLYRSQFFGLTLLSFEKNLRPIPRQILPGEFKQYLSQFPDEIQWLYNDRKGDSNYSFAQSLAVIFADNFSAIGSFFRLKLGLLLSLLSLNESNPKRNHLSVLVICDDDLMVRRLFEWSSSMIGHRFMHKSIIIPMSGISKLVPQSDKTSLKYVESGSLNYGADGVTVIECVKNLNELPDKERITLFHALETNEVIAKQSDSVDPTTSEIQLKTTIWATIEDDINEKQTKSIRGFNVLWPEVFGMVYAIPQPPKGYMYCRIPGRQEGSLSYEKWQKTIQLMAELDPEMEDITKRLITQYYMASRRVRGAKMNHISVNTLLSLAKSFAKLSLRPKITELDAVMAILLYEESLVSRFPQVPSQIIDGVISHVETSYLEEVVGPNCDKNIGEFAKRLHDFISRENKRKSLSQIFEEPEE